MGSEVKECSDCGRPFEPGQTHGVCPHCAIDAAGDIDVAVPGYELLRKLGEGGMGEVFLAKQGMPERSVALKVLRKDRVGTANYRALSERFLAEAKTMSMRLEGIPHFPQIHEAREAGELCYYSMEYIEGENLRVWAKDRPEDERLALFVRLCDAVSAAHSAAVIHRDIKPQNVLVTEGNRPKLIDFGLARDLEGEGMTEPGGLVGTVDFMSPEQARGEPATTASDIYSLGLVLLELLGAGHESGAGESKEEKVRKRAMGECPAFPSDLPRPLAAILKRALHSEASCRYGFAAQLGKDIANYRDGKVGKIEAYRARPVERVASLVKRNPWKTAFAVAGFLLLAGFAKTWSDKQRAERRTEIAQAVAGAEKANREQETEHLLQIADFLVTDVLWKLAAAGREEMAAEIAVQLSKRLEEFPGDAGNLVKRSLRLIAVALRADGKFRRNEIEDALAGYQEATEGMEELIEARERALFKSHLALFHSKQSGCFMKLERGQEGIAQADKAIVQLRELVDTAKDRGETKAWALWSARNNLSGALRKKGTMLSTEGRHQEAIAAQEESVAAIRAYEGDPIEQQPFSVGMALSGLVDAHQRAGDLQKARAAAAEAVALYDGLFAGRENDLRLIYQLSDALRNHGGILSELQEFAAASGDFERASELLDQAQALGGDLGSGKMRDWRRYYLKNVASAAEATIEETEENQEKQRLSAVVERLQKKIAENATQIR